MDTRKVFLAHLPQWNLDQPPLGISCIASFIKQHGYEVIKRDFNVELNAALPYSKRYIMEEEYHSYWSTKHEYISKIYPELEMALEEWADELAENDAGVIGFTLLSTNWIPSIQVAQKVKQRAREKIIVIGGAQVARYESGFDLIDKNNCFDFAVPGEGEVTFKEFLDCLNANLDFERVPGLLFRKGNKIIDTGVRPLIENLDELPHPTFEEYPLSLYKSLAIPILGSRGCIFSCSFCSERIFWGKYRGRSAGHLFAEIKYHYKTTGHQYFYIVDSLLNGNIPELEKFCDLIIENKLPVGWGGKVSILRQMTKELLVKMRKAGCENLEYGMESGSSKVLKDMKKAHDVALASEVLRNTADTGIKAGLFWVVGFPTETENDYLESEKFLKDNACYIDHVTPGYGCGILKGSDLYIHPEKYGIYFENDEWYSQHTSPEIRAKRIQSFRSLCVSLGYKV